jgi:hypothetical protein
MIKLTDEQLVALRNLDRKRNGEDVAFINIADARALTEAGLAVRQASGWRINDRGIALLQSVTHVANPAVGGATPIQLKRPSNEGK